MLDAIMGSFHGATPEDIRNKCIGHRAEGQNACWPRRATAKSQLR